MKIESELGTACVSYSRKASADGESAASMHFCEVTILDQLSRSVYVFRA